MNKNSIAASIERYNSKETSSCRKNEPCYSRVVVEKSAVLRIHHLRVTPFTHSTKRRIFTKQDMPYIVITVGGACACAHTYDRRSRMQMKKISQRAQMLGRMTFNRTFFRAVLAPFFVH